MSRRERKGKRPGGAGRGPGRGPGRPDKPAPAPEEHKTEESLPRGPGRPTKWTEEVRARIVTACRAGNYRKTAALAAGVSESTFHDWMSAGRRGEPGFSEFLESVEQAEAEGETELAQWARRGAEMDPRIALEFLGRRHPARWGKTRIEVTGKDDGPLGVQTVSEADLLRRLDTAELERLHALATEAAAIQAKVRGEGEGGGEP